jgi:MFS family permease
MSGLFYTLPYSTVGLLAGMLNKSKKRVLILAALTLIVSAFHMANGLTSSFFVLCAMRFLHGAFSSVINPLQFSLIADYFPPDKRGTANALLSSATFMGVALSSITIILIKAMGWRSTYGLMGFAGLFIALLTFLGMKEPKHIVTEEEI